MGAYTIFFFSTCRTTIFPFSTLTDTSDTPRLLKLCSMAVFSFSVISTFKDSPPYLVSPPPSCGRERHICPLSTGILRVCSGCPLGLFERARICTSHGPVPAWISGFRTALPLTANQSLTTGLSKHFSASTYSATAQWEASLLFQVPARGQVAAWENQTPRHGLWLYQLRRV